MSFVQLTGEEVSHRFSKAGKSKLLWRFLVTGAQYGMTLGKAEEEHCHPGRSRAHERLDRREASWSAPAKRSGDGAFAGRGGF